MRYKQAASVPLPCRSQTTKSELPSGGFIDNGLHDLNVNAGNYGVAVAADTIWFTRANNQNGALRAVTPTRN